jgi:hypothetical protein
VFTYVYLSIVGQKKSLLEKSMSQNKNDNKGQDSGFGGSMFGGTGAGGSNAGGGNSQFGGDFQGGFGSTNAVSQIFKDGGSGGGDDKKKRMMMIAAVGLTVAAVAAGGWYLFFDDSAQTETTEAVTPVAPADGTAKTEEEDAAAEDEEALEEDEVAEAPAAAAPAASGVSGSSSYSYDDRKGGPIVTASAGATIEVSLEQGFGTMYVTGKANESGKFQITNPPPGKIYWRVSGTTSVAEITVNPPPALSLDFTAPPEIAADGTLSWSASGPVSYFKLEFAPDAAFSTISSTVSTKENQAAIKNVAPGKHFVRLGGFNLAAGKWEYSPASQTSVK